MDSYMMYALFLCAIVFVLLTSISVIMLLGNVKMYKRLIQCGQEDENIKKEYASLTCGSKRWSFVGKIVNSVLCVFLILIFGFSVYTNVYREATFGPIPSLMIVESDSMSYKNPNNSYLFDNKLDNQFQTFDLVFTYSLPDESDIKLYDIVIYESNNVLVIHRIVDIDEPNAIHPNERYFKLQGDAVSQPDFYPVLYSQMKGIYRNQRIPFLGSFFKFMQTPAGWLCLLLVVGVTIIGPIVEKKIQREKKKRLEDMGFINN